MRSVSADNSTRRGPNTHKPLPSLPTATHTGSVKDQTRFCLDKGSQPRSLQRSALIAFAALFGALETVLVALWLLSNKQNGFRPIAGDDFGWTYRYGPTTVFIIIISFWRQVDHNHKVLQPWSQLARGYASARQSILLDYLSPLQPAVVWHALRNRHFAVALAASGFLVLKLLAVISTALFSTRNIHHALLNQSMTLSSRFAYSPSASTSYDPGARSAAYEAYAHLTLNLPFREGSNSEAIYQTISYSPQQPMHNTTFDANVQAVYPSMTCQSQHFDTVIIPPRNQSQDYDVQQEIRLSNPGSCNVTFSGLICHPRNAPCPETDVKLWNGFTDCGFPGGQQWAFLHYQEILYNQTADTTQMSGGRLVATSWNTTFTRAASVLCRVELATRIARSVVDVSIDPPSFELRKTQSADDDPSLEFDVHDLVSEITSSLTAAAEMFPFRDALQGIMEDVASKDGAGLFSLVGLSATAKKVLMQLALQNIALKMTKPASINVIGTVTSTHTRILINPSSFGILSGGLGLMAIISLTLTMYQRSYTVAPARSDTVGSVALMLRNSLSFNRDIYHTRFAKKSDAKTFLQKFLYHTEPGSNLIQPIPQVQDRSTHNEPPKRLQSVQDYQQQRWKPFSLRALMLGVTLVAPLLAIFLLEYIQQRSTRDTGFASIAPGTKAIVESIYSQYLAATAMLLIAALYSSLDFNATVLAPFVVLRTASSKGQFAIQESSLGSLPPAALFKFVVRRQWCGASASLAALVSSILTIIVSGLYSIDTFPVKTTIILRQVDSFVPEWLNSTYDDGGAGLVLSLIESANLSYPAFTYDALALPTIGLGQVNEQAEGFESNTINMTVSALRANLRCDEMRSPQLFTTFDSNVTERSLLYNVTFLPHIPPHCVSNTRYSNTNMSFAFSDFLSEATESSKILATASGLLYKTHFRDLHTLNSTNPGEGRFTYYLPDSPPGCPSLAIGWVAWDFVRNYANANVLVCYQEMQLIDTKLTLTYPNLTVPIDHPPLPVEESFRLLQSAINNETSFPWRIEAAMSAFSILNDSTANIVPRRVKTENPNPENYFFEGAMSAHSAFDPRLLLKDYDESIFEAIQNFYRRYMAQVAHLNMRRPFGLEQEGVKSDVPATFSSLTGSRRLVQHRVPKLILQSMLASMFLLGLVAISTGQLRSLVPWNPCSIVGIAMLLAGSKMCQVGDELPIPKDEATDNSRGRNAHKIRARVKHIAHAEVSSEISLGNESTPFLEPDLFTTPATGTVQADRRPRPQDTKSLWESFGIADRARRAQQQKKHKWKDIANGNWTDARFRLGWWKEGVFQGANGRYLNVDIRDPAWRYGIDFM